MENKMERKNYKNFYLGMLYGTGFIAGFFYGSEFGFLSFKFLISLFFTFFPTLLMIFIIKEKLEAKK